MKTSRLFRGSLAFCISVLFAQALISILGRGISEAGNAVPVVIITSFGSVLVTWNDPLIHVFFLWLSVLLFAFLFRSVTLDYAEALLLPMSILFVSIYTKSCNGVITLPLYILSILSVPVAWLTTLHGSNLGKDFCGSFVILLFLSITVIPYTCESVVCTLREKHRNQSLGKASLLVRLLIL